MTCPRRRVGRLISAIDFRKSAVSLQDAGNAQDMERCDKSDISAINNDRRILKQDGRRLIFSYPRCMKFLLMNAPLRNYLSPPR